MSTFGQRQREYFEREFRRYCPDASRIHTDNYTQPGVIEVRVWFDQFQYVYRMKVGSEPHLYHFTDDDGAVITVPLERNP